MEINVPKKEILFFFFIKKLYSKIINKNICKKNDKFKLHLKFDVQYFLSYLLSPKYK